MTQKLNRQILKEKPGGNRLVSPHQMLMLLKKNENNRVWILKQLSQLDINTDVLQDFSLNELYQHCDKIIKSTYSVKYLGMNENEMGIISRRIDPFRDTNFNLRQLPQTSYAVHKFFFPKPLKVARKPKKQPEINTQNLQIQIKKAFLKFNPQASKQQLLKMKNAVSGSWISDKGRGTVGKQGAKSKHLTTNDKVEIPDASNMSKTVCSYSRFLNNGWVDSWTRPSSPS